MSQQGREWPLYPQVSSHQHSLVLSTFPKILTEDPATFKPKRKAKCFYIHLALPAFTHPTEKDMFLGNVYQMRLSVKFALSTILLNEDIWLINLRIPIIKEREKAIPSYF